MQFLFDIKNTLLILTAILNFVLGIFIYLNGREKKINRVYSWNIAAIISWVLAMFFFRSASQTSAFFWCTILYSTPTIIASSFLYFTYIFPSQRIKKLSWRPWVIFLSNIYIIFLVIIPGMVIQEVNVRPGMEKEIIFNLIPYIFYAFYILVCFSLGFVRLFQKYLKSQGRERVQIIYLLFGYAVAANFAFVTNLIMPWLGNFSFNWLGQVFTITMVGFTSYAIIAYSLMDVKVVLRRSLVYLATLMSILFVAVIIEYSVILFMSSVPDVLNFIILVSGVSVFPWLKSRYYNFANKYFFSSLYDGQKVIAELSDKLSSTLEVGKICKIISDTLVNTFHTKAVGILINSNTNKGYYIKFNQGFKVGQKKYFASNLILNEQFVKQHKNIVVEEIRKTNTKGYEETLKILDKYGVEILTPLNIQKENIGLLVLSSKESKDMYNSEDLRVLKIIGSQSAVALQNSLLYQASQLFGEKLKKEVERATHDLRIANEHLKQLDRAKTEFISVTSHQLRTPLTGIKGYLSMFLEGDFGKLRPEQKKIMLDVFNNSNRLVRLVNIFLNVSRIESGRLKLQKSKFNLYSLVDEISRELKLEADKKKLILEVVKPKEEIYVLADRDKIADVVLNLIDNAIKYTEKGSIKACVMMNKEKARVEVKDSGVGISKEEAKELFNKFVRGKKIAQINTSGTGLGLFIAKKIIELHGGKIWVESDGEGKGSTFVFEIQVK
ncbi:MAG: ATP-binding protein [Patescibacteria group bacterium]